MEYETIIIKEWQQLLKLEPEFGGWVYRGQSNSQWDLETSLMRIINNNRAGYARGDAEDYAFAERYSLHDFKSRAHFYLNHLPSNTDAVAWLAVMQHHGTPTRLLDFSRSIYVACYFAIINTSTDACIWAIDESWLRYSGVEYAELQGIKPTNDLRFGQLAATYSAANNIVNANNFDSHEYESPRPAILMIDIGRQIPRLAIQQGTFLMPTDLSLSFGANLDLAIAGTKPDCSPIKKILLPIELRCHALMHLRMMNITAETLFPGIDGFASSLIQHNMI
jgi:FRG domain